MSASFVYVVVNPGTLDERSEKRWQMLCNGKLTNALQLCQGPLGVQTLSGSPIFLNRASLYAAADVAGWKRGVGDSMGDVDQCPISALLLGL